MKQLDSNSRLIELHSSLEQKYKAGMITMYTLMQEPIPEPTGDKLTYELRWDRTPCAKQHGRTFVDMPCSMKALYFLSCQATLVVSGSRLRANDFLSAAEDSRTINGPDGRSGWGEWGGQPSKVKKEERSTVIA